MNFINEKYPKIFSPPSTKKTYISSSYNIHSNNNDNNNNNNIPTPSPSRKVHIKRSGSVVIDQGGQQTIIHSTPSFNESNRRTNDNNNNMNMNTNYSNNTVTNKIPIHIFWYNFRVICVIITYIIVVNNCSNDIFVFINRDFFMNILLS